MNTTPKVIVIQDWLDMEDSKQQQCLHRCDLSMLRCYCGSAVTECSEDEDGTLWAGNGEYESQVNFCPGCGYKAKVPSPEDGQDISLPENP